jgi:hypothetical protein
LTAARVVESTVDAMEGAVGFLPVGDQGQSHR